MKLVLILTLGLLLVGCDPLMKKPESQPYPGTPTKEQAEAMTKQAEVMLSNQNRLFDLQMEVVKQCVDRGWVPVLVAGNVDCKKP